jgi:ubiquitin C-terminal hydrolase
MLTVSRAPKWSEEFCTLFTLTINEVKQCIACGHRERSDVQHEGPGMMVDVTPTTPDWNQAITNFFHRTQAGLHCANCATRNHDVETNIVAAPQILRIALQIFKQDIIFPDPEEEDGEVTVNRYKVNHTLQHPDILDLTNHQLHNTFPLQYKLSSVISHSGPGLKEKGGHYIASVRGPGLTPITCISDERRERFSQLQFESNPQTTALSRGNFQVYILTYVREDVALTTKAQLTAAALM